MAAAQHGTTVWGMMTGEDYEARKDEHRRDWPGYHDPLLYDSMLDAWLNSIDDDPNYSDYLNLIAKVREDQRIRTLNAVQNGSTVMDVFGTYYGQGLSAAREAVAALTPFVFAYQTWVSGDYGYDEGPWVKKENALAAIDALRGDA